MELLIENYGSTIMNIIGGLAVLILLINIAGVGLDTPTHTFTEAEVGQEITLIDGVSLGGKQLTPTIKYDVKESDVGKEVYLGRGVLGKTLYIVFDVMQRQ